MARYDGRSDPHSYFAGVLQVLRALGDGRSPARPGRQGAARRVQVRELNGCRWDPGYWCAEAASLLERVRVPLAPLGEFIEHITYGPIVTGERARRPSSGNVLVVGQREIRPTGLDPRRALRVREGGERDPARCRLRAGDLVFARSGAGSLLKGRVAVFGGRARATVGCFVDLVRLVGLSPAYAALSLRSRIVRSQVERLANGVGTPNLSFGEIRGLLVPRLARRLEKDLARADAIVRSLHGRALSAGREPVAAARRLARAIERLEEAALG